MGGYRMYLPEVLLSLQELACERLARPPFWRRRFFSHARGLVGWRINI